MSERPTPETDAISSPSDGLGLSGYFEMVDHACRLERERDSLQEQLDAAIMLGKMQERRHARELEQVREQYRLASAAGKLLQP